MKKPGVVWLVWIVMLVVVFSATCAQSEAIARKTAKEKLAILDLEPTYGIERELAKGLSVIIRDEIHSFGDYEVLSREDLQAVASQEQLKQALGCDEGGTCLVDFGRAIGTRFMVVGSISKFGTTYTISLRMLDTKGETAGVINRTSMNCKCAEDDLIVIAQNVAAKLLGKETPEMLAAKQVAEKERLAAEKSKADEAEKKKFAAEQARLAEEKKRKIVSAPVVYEKPVAPFKITEIFHPSVITMGGDKGDLTVYWSGNPVFPVTMTYFNKGLCPSPYNCVNPTKQFKVSANPLYFPGALWCNDISRAGDYFFDYGVVLEDAAGNRTQEQSATFTCR
ncbi:MAG: hypothetical protein V2B20_21835 [Pseudomonadota bacterium]